MVRLAALYQPQKLKKLVAETVIITVTKALAEFNVLVLNVRSSLVSV
jgi:hypothetical protein